MGAFEEFLKACGIPSIRKLRKVGLQDRSRHAKRSTRKIQPEVEEGGLTFCSFITYFLMFSIRLAHHGNEVGAVWFAVGIML